MKNLNFLFCLLISSVIFSQTNETLLNLNRFDDKQAIDFQNQIRDYFDLKPYERDDTLSKIAFNWASHLAKIDSLKISDDQYGESIFLISREYLNFSNKNIFMEASISWLLNKGSGDDSPYLQIISETATKVGFGVSYNDERYYVVAKYDSIY